MTKIALRNPVGVLMFGLALALLGVVGIQKLPLDLFPNINIPVIMIGTIYPGASPELVERTVSYPIEMAASQTADLDYVSSQSRYGLSVVRAWFHWGADINSSLLQVAQMVQSIQKNLPHGIFPPFVVAFDASNIPVANVTLESTEVDEKGLYDLAINTIAPQLAGVPGISYASPTGGKVREITVRMNPNLMRERGVDAADVEKAVANANLLMSAGDIKVGALDYNVFTNSQVQSVDELNNVVVKTVNGVPIHIRDIGVASDGAAIQVNIARINGHRGVYMAVYRQPGTNMIEVVDALKAAIPKLTGVPASVKMKVAFDQSKFIRASIAGLKHEAVQGAILAILVIVFFLGSFRSTTIIFVALPLSILATFFGLYAAGQTINAFTLGGMTLVAGRLIDDAIVVLENIHRHMEQGKKPLQAAYDGASEVALAVLASTITTIIVFAPVVMVEGVAKFLFTPMLITIAIAMGASYVVAMSVIPVLCQKFLRVHGHGGEHEHLGPVDRALRASTALLDRLDAFYGRLLTRAMGVRWWVMGGVLALFAASLLLVPHIGSEFFPEADESQFRIVLRAPIGTRIEETEKQVETMEAITKQVIPAKYIKTLLANIGTPRGSRSSFYSTNTGPHSAYLQVELVPPGERDKSTEQLVADLRPALLKALPGRTISFDPGGVMKKVLNFGYESPIDVELSGYDLVQAHQAAQKVAAAMATVPGVKDVLVSREENFPELDVKVDREKAALQGLSERDASRAILDSLLGNYSGASYFEDPKSGNEYFMVTRFDDQHLSEISDLGNITVMTKNHTPVYLKSIAKIDRNSGPVQLDRRHMQRVIDITANPEGRDLGAVSSDIRKALDKVELPPGFAIHLRGQTEEQETTFKSLKTASILALLLVFMLLATQFRSVLHPLIMMTSVPLGMIGVFAALFLTHTALSTTSFMGIIMMVGVAVSNGVLLIDFANVLRRQGQDVEKAVITAARTRLRPILMTSVATLVGLIPMALGIGEGSETNAPLARAVIGGLGVSTFLTLFFVPLLYATVEKRFGKVIDLKAERELDQLGDATT